MNVMAAESGDSDGVGIKQQSNKNGSEKMVAFAMAAATGTGLTMATTMIAPTKQSIQSDVITR